MRYPVEPLASGALAHVMLSACMSAAFENMFAVCMMLSFFFFDRLEGSFLQNVWWLYQVEGTLDARHRMHFFARIATYCDELASEASMRKISGCETLPEGTLCSSMIKH